MATSTDSGRQVPLVVQVEAVAPVNPALVWLKSQVSIAPLVKLRNKALPKVPGMVGVLQALTVSGLCCEYAAKISQSFGVEVVKPATEVEALELSVPVCGLPAPGSSGVVLFTPEYDRNSQPNVPVTVEVNVIDPGGVEPTTSRNR